MSDKILNNKEHSIDSSKVASLLRYFQEIEVHLLQDKKPTVYLESIYDSPWFQQYPFDMITKLRRVEQSPKYHPEGNVWNHTMMVVDQAAKRKGQSKNQKVFMWSALLHDIGKTPATKVRKGKITAYNHDRMGAEMAREFLSCFTKDSVMIDGICSLVRYHMQILYVAKNINLGEIKEMKKQTDVEEIALLGLCDRLGRTNSNDIVEEEHIRRFLEVCRRV